MTTMNQIGSYKDLESGGLNCRSFEDVLGHKLDVTYDAITGSIIELSCQDASGDCATVVRKQPDYPTEMWVAAKFCNGMSDTGSRHGSRDAGSSDQLPSLTKFLADARFDAEHGELTLASRSFSKRWIFRTDGSIEFFSADGHMRFS